jgi:Ca2+-binding EF-hand superfamily protein
VLQEFELTIDVDKLLRDMDKDLSGTVDYQEFEQLLGDE